MTITIDTSDITHIEHDIAILVHDGSFPIVPDKINLRVSGISSFLVYEFEHVLKRKRKTEEPMVIRYNLTKLDSIWEIPPAGRVLYLMNEIPPVTWKGIRLSR